MIMRMWSVVMAFYFLDLYSVLYFSRPQSEGWPHRERTFSIYLCFLSF